VCDRTPSLRFLAVTEARNVGGRRTQNCNAQVVAVELPRLQLQTGDVGRGGLTGDFLRAAGLA